MQMMRLSVCSFSLITLSLLECSTLMGSSASMSSKLLCLCCTSQWLNTRSESVIRKVTDSLYLFTISSLYLCILVLLILPST
jgi:hypothetical protein